MENRKRIAMLEAQVAKMSEVIGLARADTEQGSEMAEWLAKAEKVYALAELVMDRAMRAEVGAEIPKGVARPWAAKL